MGLVRGERQLRVLFFTAVAVSVVHYTDNYFNYDDYPEPTTGLAPSQTVVGLAWFPFTAFGVAGYLMYRRGRERLAALLLAAYSGSGLVGFGHYAVPGAFDMPWWRQAHVVADITCGLALVAFAIWTVQRPRTAPAG
jgi:hypothetical protein